MNFMKKIPPGAEASNVLVGEVDFLDRPITAFVRLAPAMLLTGLTEVPVPTRWTPVCSNILPYKSFGFPALVLVKVTSCVSPGVLFWMFVITWRIKCSFMYSKPTWVIWKTHNQNLFFWPHEKLWEQFGRGGMGGFSQTELLIWTGCHRGGKNTLRNFISYWRLCCAVFAEVLFSVTWRLMTVPANGWLKWGWKECLCFN